MRWSPASRAYRERVDELADSAALVGDPDGLRRRLAEDGVAGIQDMLTSWMPLMDIPVRIGGLAVRPGGHLGPPRPPRPLGVAEPGWATTSYEPGDVIIFHCLVRPGTSG